jgi:hypothetical protein
MPSMSDEEAAKNLRLFDRRIVERNIKKGIVTRKDYDKYLKALGDTAPNIASAEERVEDEPDDDDLDALDDVEDEEEDDEPSPPQASPAGV